MEEAEIILAMEGMWQKENDEVTKQVTEEVMVAALVVALVIYSC